MRKMLCKYSMPFCLISNYSPEVINIPRREDEFNIMLPRVNNFVIKQKRHGIFCSLNKIWENKGQNLSFFCKN